MADRPDLDEAELDFLLRVFEAAGGDTGVQVDMYAVGEAAGLDRTASRKLAENLIGWELVEIRTLAGGISLATDGVEFLREAGMAGGGVLAEAPLGTAPVLGEGDRQRVETLLADLKARAGERSWHFAALDEFMADIKTMEAQLASPRPKNDVMRGCLQSIADNLAQCGSRENLERVRRLLG